MISGGLLCFIEVLISTSYVWIVLAHFMILYFFYNITLTWKSHWIKNNECIQCLFFYTSFYYYNKRLTKKPGFAHRNHILYCPNKLQNFPVYPFLNMLSKIKCLMLSFYFYASITTDCMSGWTLNRIPVPHTLNIEIAQLQKQVLQFG